MAEQQTKPAPAQLRHKGWLARTTEFFWGMLRLRCPRCKEGKIFRGAFAMNDPCPICGLLFQREEGYFLGAMYFSYLLASAILIPCFFVLAALLPSLDGVLVALLTTLLYVPLVPLVFRYSRVLWIYFERLGCPSDLSAVSYEKVRQWQIAEKQPGSQKPQADT
jgi:uncharacterized protein (DUF983 family)